MGMGGAWQPWSQAVDGQETTEGTLDFPGLVAMLSGERTLAQRTCRQQIHNFRRVSGGAVGVRQWVCGSGCAAVGIWQRV